MEALKKTILEKQQALKQSIQERNEKIKQLQKESAAEQKEYEEFTKTVELLHLAEKQVSGISKLEALTVPISFGGEETSKAQIKTEEVQKLFQNESSRTSYDEEEKAKSYYVIFNGPNQGIYDHWSKAAIFITGEKGIIHKKYISLKEAKEALEDHRRKESYAEVTRRPDQKNKEAIPEGRKIPIIGKIPRTSLTISKIQTKQQIEDNCRITRKIMEKEYNFLLHYKEEDKETSIYPIDSGYQGPKAVILPEADPIRAYMLYQAGLASCIYFNNADMFKFFPAKMKTAITNVISKIVRGKEGFLRCFGTIPEFNEEGEVTQSAIQLCQIGVSNKNYPAIGRHEPREDEDELDYLANNYVLILTKGIKVNGRINYSAPSTIIWSHQARDASELDRRIMNDFLAKLINNNFEYTKAVKEFLCQKMQKEFPEDHICQQCVTSGSEEEIVQEVEKESAMM